jgi:predicted RNA binding protein YcfA (HicA-like mRNA interferase family)
MKLPRDLSGPDLAKLLGTLGYHITRWTRSHLRLTTQQQGEHHVTVSNHSPLKIGTLSGILTDFAQHFGPSRDDLLRRLLPS